MSEEEKKKNPKFKQKKKFVKKEKEEKPSKICMNDPSWYVLNPELLRDAASLPFSHFLGKGLPIQSTAGYKSKEAVIVKLPYLYMLGVARNSDDPVNLAIRNLYTFVRHQNSGHANYESADLGMYLIATSCVIATLAHLERCIGVAKCYQRRSSIMPREVLLALGCNPATLIPNLANYTTRLNVLWSRVSSLCIPKDFTFLKRWLWMNSQIFKDHESDKAALYLFKPVGVPQFNHFTLNAGSISQPNKESLTPTIDDWFNDAEAALTTILQDEDMNIMSGDILKAYGEENLLSFGLTPIDYVVEPVFVEEMLPQIQHAQTPIAKHVTGAIVTRDIHTGIDYETAQKINDVTDPIYVAAQDKDYFTIFQFDQNVICTPCEGEAAAATIDSTSKVLYWEAINPAYFYGMTNHQDRLLNSYKKDVPPEDVMISTRLMYTDYLETRVTNSSKHPWFYESCGTELLLKFVCYYKEENNPNFTALDSGSFIFINNNDYAAAYAVMQVSALASQMDWAPITYITVYVSGTGGSITENANAVVYGDLDNFTNISPKTLSGLHLTATLAEFSVTKYNLIKA